MRPLVVRYEPMLGNFYGALCIGPGLSAELFEGWKQLLNSGRYDEVVLIGPAACTGWRIYVDRPVLFQERAPIDEQDAREQMQAKFRIMQANETNVKLISPYNLIQEWVERDVHYPWRVLVTCVLLNKTSGRQVRPIFGDLFDRYKTPESILEAPIEDLIAILRPLGLQTVRAKRLRELTADYLQRHPLSEMRGVGQYAVDAFNIFCRGLTVVEPQDTWLKPYVEWRRNGGRRVEWPESDFDVWWGEGAA